MRVPTDPNDVMSQALNALMMILFAAVILRLIYEALAPILPWLIGAILLVAVGRIGYLAYNWWRNRYWW